MIKLDWALDLLESLSPNSFGHDTLVINLIYYPIETQNSSYLDNYCCTTKTTFQPFGRKTVHVPSMEVFPIAKFLNQIWLSQLSKYVYMSESGVREAKTNCIWTCIHRVRLHVQHFELCAHGQLLWAVLQIRLYFGHRGPPSGIKWIRKSIDLKLLITIKFHAQMWDYGNHTCMGNSITQLHLTKGNLEMSRSIIFQHKGYIFHTKTS